MRLNQNTELLPCPFCGGEPRSMDRARSEDDQKDGKGDRIFFVACYCGGYSARAHQFGHSLEEVTAAWNTRALTPESEGIAGKGDLCPDCGSEMAMECQGLSVRAGTTGCNSPARPQEIDVEQMVILVVDAMCKLPNEEFRNIGAGASLIRWTINHLHSSGYLSAQSPATQNEGS